MQSKLGKSLFAVAASFIVLCLGSPAQASLGEDGDTSAGAEASAKVASVNGTVISRDQFDNAMSYQLEIASIRGVSIADAQLPELQYEVLENLITQELLYQGSQQFGISVSEDEIDTAYEERRQKADFETGAEFEAALKASGKTVASYRDEIKQGLAIDRFVQSNFTDQTAVSDSEAKNYYDSNPAYFQQPEQVRVSHIMIRVASGADQSEKDAARGKIEKVAERLKAGEDFATVAGEVSEDANTSSNGGDLGYFSKGQVTQSFEDAAFALAKGGISDIVETGSGYHIIKLTDKTEARTIGFEESKADIVDSLKTSKVNSSVESYIKLMKISSTIVTYPLGQ